MKDTRGFLGGASGKEPACQLRRNKRHGFNLWVGKIPWWATHFSILAWRIPWTAEPGVQETLGSQGVRHNRSNLAHTEHKGHKRPSFLKICFHGVGRESHLRRLYVDLNSRGSDKASESGKNSGR